MEAIQVRTVKQIIPALLTTKGREKAKRPQHRSLRLSYSKPGKHFDLDAADAMIKEALRKERFGYLEHYVDDRSESILDHHVSFIGIA